MRTIIICFSQFGEQEIKDRVIACAGDKALALMASLWHSLFTCQSWWTASSWHSSMDVILVANECVDVRKITKALGILCKGKSLVYPINEVQGINSLAKIFGREIGKLPTTYLGMPMGAKSKSQSIWNAILEKCGNLSIGRVNITLLEVD
ncbi:hypothetical protein H5410_031488 [Solanum commersonii]|uniref:Uncharacterized protein n=1 Tax=Solanum commersonii TaxID=4109 RepID=A0A9J5YMI0_SOLCO|nr:hypothetical protein H5410_031488 [Solanum commersonii]